MSLLFDLVKTATAKPTDKVTLSVKKSRINQCNTCTHRVDANIPIKGFTRSCGKYLNGHKVTHNGEEKKLCGCDIDDKTDYKYDGCPLDKW